MYIVILIVGNNTLLLAKSGTILRFTYISTHKCSCN